MYSLDLPGGQKALLVLVGFIDLGKSVDPVFSVLNWRGSGALSQSILDELATVDTIPIQSGLGKQAHWGIFVTDERKKFMACLETTGQSVTVDMPYIPDQVVFSFVEALARELDAHFSGSA
ncbi:MULTISPECIES: hypothetical protein [unclassified Duganella]|uniref:hypothetical protein n=1 Tax=unclassified Duganella TaxID=2636909 RepID=UPI0006F322E1|nr:MULTISPECIES: hypothetical protein [unclassified Duganella]KQV56407.1 hypothetical protein ASD07_27225 [Duganella sp. Root336D2]KRB96475.1 hypothetical protein ASE26_25825 [Duganella sp. Root198D2]